MIPLKILLLLLLLECNMLFDSSIMRAYKNMGFNKNVRYYPWSPSRFHFINLSEQLKHMLRDCIGVSDLHGLNRRIPYRLL